MAERISTNCHLCIGGPRGNFGGSTQLGEACGRGDGGCRGCQSVGTLASDVEAEAIRHDSSASLVAVERCLGRVGAKRFIIKF